MSVLARKNRFELVAEYQLLLFAGWTIAEIAERDGRGYSTVANLLADPDGSKQRARRKRYQGKCSDCGAATDGSNIAQPSAEDGGQPSREQELSD